MPNKHHHNTFNLPFISLLLWGPVVRKLVAAFANIVKIKNNLNTFFHVLRNVPCNKLVIVKNVLHPFTAYIVLEFIPLYT